MPEEEKEQEEVITPAKDTIEIIGAAVEEMLNSLFENIVAPYSTEEMNMLIEEDTTVLDIVRLIVVQMKKGETTNWRPESKERWDRVINILASARKVAAKVGRPMLEHYFTCDNAMKVFKERRKDLYERFQQEDGKKWLEKNMSEIMDFLLR